MCVWERRKKEKETKLYYQSVSPLYKAARLKLELGWEMQIQAVCLPAPSEAAEQHAASYTHALTHTECRGLGWSSLVSRFQTLLHMHVHGAEAFLATRSQALLSLPSFFPLSCSPLSPLPSSSTPLCCFPCPYSCLPSLFSLTRFPSALSFALRVRLVRRTEWHAADAGRAPCLLQGPLKKTRLHVCWGTWPKVPEEAKTSTFFTLFSSAASSVFKRGKKQKTTMRTNLCQLVAQFFFLGVLPCFVDSKGTFYGGHINPFYGNRYNLYKAGLNPPHSPNKPMTRHK